MTDMEKSRLKADQSDARPIEAAAPAELPASDGNLSEEDVQTRLEIIFGGGHARCPAGIADIVTDKCLIEIKAVPHWKAAIGQLLAYRNFFGNRRTILYLFGDAPRGLNWNTIRDMCDDYEIELMRHETDYARILAESKQYNAAKAKRDAVGVSERMLVKEADTPDDELEVSIEAFDTQMRSFTAMIKRALRSFKSFPACQLSGRVAALELKREFEGLFARFELIVSEANDTVHCARAFIESEIEIHESSEVPISEFDAVFRRWCDVTKCSAYRKVRKNVRCILEELYVTQKKRNGKTFLVGIRLTNPITGGSHTKIKKAAAMIAATAAPPTDSDSDQSKSDDHDFSEGAASSYASQS